jgi:thiaminase
MAGNHYYDGFIKDYRKEEAKKIIGEIVESLNEGKMISTQEIKEKLRDYTP